MEERTDVLVVGASLSGCIAAKHAARRGHDVVVLEEHREVGKQRKCTSIVSASGLPLLGVDYKPAVLHEVRGAFIHSPRATMPVRARETKAYVLDRQLFDEQCAREAEQAGATLSLGEPALLYDDHAVRTDRRTLKARVLIGADGASSRFARGHRFPEIPAGRHALCYEAEYEGARLDDPSMVDVFLDREAYPGFFAWAVPTCEDGVRVGLGTTRHDSLARGRQKLFENDARVREMLGGAKKVREFHALIPLAHRERTQLGTTLLVGDAAGIVKATTGGGWVMGGSAARLAGEAAGAYLAEEAPLEYERAWRARLEGALGRHRRIRAFLDGLGNRQLDWLVGGLAAVRFDKVLEWFGDMDFVVRG
jgi:geranylgeranyl reductase family protein